MIHLRLIAITAGIAFILALLTGLVSGVGFGRVLLRSLFTGVGFGGLAFGIDFVIKQFLPELITSESGQMEKSEESVSQDVLDSDQGNNVNIVLDEEYPQQVSDLEDESEGEFVEEVEDVSDTGDVENVEDVDAGNPQSDEQNAGTGIADEIGDELPSLDQFSSTFNSVEEDVHDGGGRTAALDTSVDVGGNEHSASDVAKAVQTLISKDKKG